MRIFRFMIAAIALMIAGPLLAEKAPLSATPASKWAVALEDGLCHLSRTFRTTQGDVQLILTRHAPYYSFDLSIVSDGISRRNNTPYTQYGAGSEPLRHSLSYRLTDGEWEGFAAQLPLDYFDLPIEQSLIVSDAFAYDFALPLTNIGSALAVMDQCLDELMRSWGLDPLEQRSLTRLVSSDNEDITDLIHDALRRTQRARNHAHRDSLNIRLIVAADGRPTSCVIEGPVDETNDGRSACAMLMRSARFDSALDANGDPTESFVILEGYSYTRNVFVF